MKIITIGRNLIYDFLLERQESTLPIPHVKQPLNNLCWAACYKMVHQWHNKQEYKWCDYVGLQSKSCLACISPYPECDAPRLTSHVLKDWRSLGFKLTMHYDRCLSIKEVRENIKNANPVQAFIKYRHQQIGHFFLIVGTGRVKYDLDSTYVVADSLNNRIVQVEISEFGLKGEWCQSWIVKDK